MVEDLTARLPARWAGIVDGAPAAVSIALRAADGPVAELGGDQRHYAASTIKLAVLGAWLAQRRAGEARASGSAMVHARFAGVDGARFELLQLDDQDDLTWSRLGHHVPLSELAERMITVSSNIATDVLVERLGLNAVNDFLTRAGLADQLTMGRLIGDQRAEIDGHTNQVTAPGLAQLLWGISNADLLVADDAATAVTILAGQTYLDGIPAGLPDGVWSASKGGWVPGVRHDVALVRPDGRPAYVLAVCTTSDLPDADALDLVRRVSADTYTEWISWHA